MSGDTWALYCLSHQGSPPYIYVCIYIYYIHTHIRVKLKAKKLPLKILSSLKLHLLVSPPFHRPPPLCHTALPLKRESWWWFCLDCTERERALIFFFLIIKQSQKAFSHVANQAEQISVTFYICLYVCVHIYLDIYTNIQMSTRRHAHFILILRIGVNGIFFSIFFFVVGNLLPL